MGYLKDKKRKRFKTLNTNSKLLVVIATYNEIDNLPRLVGQLESLLPLARLLVIDDASPDGTGHWCSQSVTQHPQLSVIHRSSKSGLGSATKLGLQSALDQNFQFVATMDADFSHDPAALVELLTALDAPEQSRFGVAIGSRYVYEGVTEGWPLYRRMASWSVNWYSRMMLGLTTKDNSGAFRVYRCDALRTIALTDIRSSGYGYLQEILWRLRKSKVEMVELPIVFRDRERGKSKANFRDGLKVFWQITLMGLGRFD